MTLVPGSSVLLHLKQMTCEKQHVRILLLNIPRQTPKVISEEKFQECPRWSSLHGAGSKAGCPLVTQQEACLAPRFSWWALPPLAVPHPKTTPESLLPRHPQLTLSILHPGPEGMATSFSLHYGLPSQLFCSGRHLGTDCVCTCEALGDRLCVQKCNMQENAFRPSLWRTVIMIKGQGALPSLPNPSLPSFILSFSDLSYPLPHVFSFLSPCPPIVITH